MATVQQPNLPFFQPFATASALLTDEEMDRLIAEHEPLLAEGKLGFGNANASVRRSKVHFFGTEERYHWLYRRIWGAALECNRQFFAFDIANLEPNIQLARYDGAVQGFYDWHTDFGGMRPLRKISVSIQLSRATDYEGGDLELMYEAKSQQLDRTRGAFIAFPSFMLHRVAPVTRGTRWSLVAWVVGNRYR